MLTLEWEEPWISAGPRTYDGEWTDIVVESVVRNDVDYVGDLETWDDLQRQQ